MNEGIQVTGEVEIVKYDENHNETQRLHFKNLVVSSGKELIAKLLSGNSSSYVDYIAVGTNNTAAASAQTALSTEVARVQLTSKNVAANVISFVGTFPAGSGTGVLVEAGLFNASTDGTMVCRTVFDAVTKGANDSVAVTWTVTIG